MIYVNFDKYGVLSTLELNDETIFKGNNRVNKIFVCFDGIELKPTHYLTYSALVNENEYNGDLTDLASVRTTYNGKDGYTFYLFSNLTAQAGTLKLSVRLVDRTTDEILVSGILPLIVQDTAVSTYSNVNITTTQYQALLTAFDDLAQTFNETNFKTINEESLFGEGNITLPTTEYVDSLDNNLRNYVDGKFNTLNNADTTLINRINEQNKVIEKQDKRIKQLELASEGNTLLTTTEEDIGYEINATSDILPFAEIDKIGGMTYKSDNLLIYDDVPATTTNGITYRVENGVFYYSGTATARVDINVNLSKPLELDGEYKLAFFNNQSGGTMRLFGGSELLNSLPISYANRTDTLKYGKKSLTQLSFMISAETSFVGAELKPMLVLVSRNLLDLANKEANYNGIDYKVEDGVITLNGTTTSGTSLYLHENVLLKKKLPLNKSFTASFTFSGTFTNNIELKVSTYDGTNYDVINCDSIKTNETTKTKTFTITKESYLRGVMFYMPSGTTLTNVVIKSVLVETTTATAPTEYQVGFDGLRNSAVNQVVVKGANLQKTNWSGINSTIELSETLKAGQKYTICVYVNKDKVDCGINLLEHNNGANNLLFNNSYTNWSQPETGWVSFVITPIVDTNYLRMNGYGITDQELQGAVLKGALVEENKWVKANLYKPYKEPTTYTISTSITSIDGYSIGIDETYYNYVDYENRKFVENTKKVVLDGSADENWSMNTADNGNGIANFLISFSSLGLPNYIRNENTDYYIANREEQTTTQANTTSEGVYLTTSVIYVRVKSTTANSVALLRNYLADNPVEIVYAIATPIETDLSYRITDDFIVEVEGGGTLVFENEHENAIPFAWTYQEKL